MARFKTNTGDRSLIADVRLLTARRPRRLFPWAAARGTERARSESARTLVTEVELALLRERNLTDLQAASRRRVDLEAAGRRRLTKE